MGSTSDPVTLDFTLVLCPTRHVHQKQWGKESNLKTMFSFSLLPAQSHPFLMLTEQGIH